MKKFKNLVIGGIQSKMFNLILVTVLLLTVAFSAVSFYRSGLLSRLAEESGERQQEAISEVNDTVMSSVIEKSMGRSTALEAQLADEMFHGLKSRVEMLGEYAGKLFEQSGSTQRIRTYGPDPERNGEVTAQLFAAEGVDIQDYDLRDRIGLIGNMRDLMITLYGVSEQTNSCFIALPDGVFLIVDDRSAAKFDETGALMEYDPRTRPWYIQAVEKGELIFTDVETDAFTGDIGIVSAMPVYQDGELVAVVGSDLFLNSMQQAVAESEDSGSFSFVVNQNGHIVFSPKKEGPFRVEPAIQASDLRKSANSDFAKLINDALVEETGMRTISFHDGDYYMVGVPVKTVGWTLVSVCEKASAKAPAELIQQRYQEIQSETENEYRRGTKDSQIIALVLLLGVAVLMAAGSIMMSKRIVEPLNNITRKIASLGGNDLEFKMEDSFRTGDEIEELATSFADLSHKTVNYMETIKEVTAEKERISTELSLANSIQKAMLPHIFPAFPDRPDFDVYATMDPAKGVGGDFYDYFLIDDDHLCLVIADVSGKGVPAALFMMTSKIILQSCAMLGRSPAEILAKTNEAICSNNEAQMFVTVWVGILDLNTGLLKAANAGHEYPVLKDPNGPYRLYKDRHGIVIGGVEGAPYFEYEVQLYPGSKLFVYTDGVKEAANAQKELFGVKRILETLNEIPDAGPHEVLQTIRKKVDEFVQDEEQFDDLTMLSFEYKGKRPERIPEEDTVS